MQIKSSKNRGRRILSFLLSFALVMTLLPMNIVSANGCTIVPGTALAGEMMTVRIGGLTGGTTYKLTANDGTAKYAPSNYRIQSGGVVTNITPGSGRTPISQTATFAVPYGSTEVTIFISLANAVEGTNFTLTLFDSSGTQLSGPTTVEIRGTNTGSAPVVETTLNKTILLAGGFPGVYNYSYTFNGTYYEDRLYFDELDPEPTKFPAGVSVRVWGSDETAFTTVQIPFYANMITDITATRTLTGSTNKTFTRKQNTTIWETTMTVLDVINTPIPYTHVTVAESGLFPTEVPISSWKWLSGTTYQATVPAYKFSDGQELILEVTLVQEVSSPNMTGFREGSVAWNNTTAKYFTNEDTTGTPNYVFSKADAGNSTIWYVENSVRVHGLNLAGLNYTILLGTTSTTEMNRAAVLESTEFEELFEIDKNGIVTLTIKQTNKATGLETLRSAVIGTIAIEETAIQPAPISSVTHNTSHKFYAGQTKIDVMNAVATAFNYNNIIMTDGLSATQGSKYTLTPASTGLFTDEQGENPFTDPLVAGHDYYLGITVTIGTKEPVIFYAKVDVSENQLDGAVSFGVTSTADANGFYKANDIVVVMTVNSPQFDHDSVTGIVLENKNDSSDTITLTKSDTTFTAGASSFDSEEGTYVFKEATGFKLNGLPIDSATDTLLASVISEIKIDNVDPVINSFIGAGQTVTLTVTDEFLTAANILAAITFAKTSATPTEADLGIGENAYIDRVEAINLSDGSVRVTLTLDTSFKAWAGDVTVTDPAGNESASASGNFTFSSAPTINNITKSTDAYVDTLDVIIDVNSNGFQTTEYFYKLFEEAQDTGGWDFATLTTGTGAGGWTKTSSPVNEVRGIDENGFLYVIVKGTTNGGAIGYATDYIEITNILDQPPAVDEAYATTNVDGTDKIDGVEILAEKGEFSFTAYAYENADSSVLRKDAVKLQEVWYVLVDKNTYDTDESGLNEDSDFKSWMTAKDGNGLEVIKLVEGGLVNTNSDLYENPLTGTLATDIYAISSKVMDITENNMYVIVYVESYRASTSSYIPFETSVFVSELFDMIEVPPTDLKVVLDGQTPDQIPGLDGEWAIEEITLPFEITSETDQNYVPFAMLWTAVPEGEDAPDAPGIIPTNIPTDPEEFASFEKAFGWKVLHGGDLDIGTITYDVEGKNYIVLALYSGLGELIPNSYGSLLYNVAAPDPTQLPVETIMLDLGEATDLTATLQKQEQSPYVVFEFTAAESASGIAKFLFAKSTYADENIGEAADWEADGLNIFEVLLPEPDEEEEPDDELRIDIPERFLFPFDTDVEDGEYVFVAVNGAGVVSTREGTFTVEPTIPIETDNIVIQRQEINLDGSIGSNWGSELNIDLDAGLGSISKPIVVGGQYLKIAADITRSDNAPGWDTLEGEKVLVSIDYIELLPVAPVNELTINSDYLETLLTSIVYEYLEEDPWTGEETWARRMELDINLSNIMVDVLQVDGDGKLVYDEYDDPILVETISLPAGTYAILLFPSDDVHGDMQSQPIGIVFEYDPEPFEVESIEFTVTHAGTNLTEVIDDQSSGVIGSSGNAPGLQDVFAEVVRYGDMIEVEVVFSKDPLPNFLYDEEDEENEEWILVMDIGGQTVVLDSNGDQTYRGTIPVVTEDIVAIEVGSAKWTAFLAEDGGRTIEDAEGIWTDKINKHDVFAYLSYSYIMYSLELEDAAGNKVKHNGISGLSLSGLEPEIVNGPISFKLPGGPGSWDNEATEGMNAFKFGRGYSRGFQFEFDTNVVISPVFTDFAGNLVNLYGDVKPIHTVVQFTITTEDETEYVYEVDLNDFNEFGLFNEGAASLTGSENFDTGVFTNTLTIPSSLFFSSFEDGSDPGEFFDFSEPIAEIGFSVKLVSLAGVEEAEGAKWLVDAKFEFVTANATVVAGTATGAVVDDEDISDMELVNLYKEDLSLVDDLDDLKALDEVVGLFDLPSRGNRTLYLYNNNENHFGNSTYLFYKVMDFEDAMTFIEGGTFQEAMSWNGGAVSAAGIGTKLFELQYSKDSVDQVLLIMTQAFTGDTAIFAIVLVADTSSVTLNTVDSTEGSLETIGYKEVKIVFEANGEATVNNIEVKRSLDDSAFVTATFKDKSGDVTTALPAAESDDPIDIYFGTTKIGTIECTDDDTGQYTVTITGEGSDGLYKISALTVANNPTTAIFDFLYVPSVE